MISPNIKTKIVIIPVAIPVIALTLSLIPELFASFIAKVVVREEADKLKQNGYYTEEKDGLEVLLPPKGVAPGEKVQLSLSKFFWLKKIMVQGIRAYQY